ncbi:DnaD domain-containing protein [Desnuesiella massiliensis]|uniref:DnaD domain-containing protein n=1 Tax=Desnuesiella massiliensis TaxID=1650662 RepID=UPI0006E17441|nr:DnaD domain protein [Desnuesiella massiliensis]
MFRAKAILSTGIASGYQSKKELRTNHLVRQPHSGETKLWPGEEEEEKEEKEIEEEVEEYTEAAKADLKVKGKLREVIDAFNNNIHPMTPMEYEKILDWAEDVEPGVIILAIEEAVKHNARNFVYIERVLNNWHDLGHRTVKAVNAYKRDFKKQKKHSSKDSDYKPNAKAYKLLDEEDSGYAGN